MNNFNFTPVDGLLNKESFPSKPESEEQARTQIQTPLNQIKDFINTDLLTDGFASSKTANGYTKLPNGIILQWGEVTFTLGNSGGTGNTYSSFPIPFPNKSLVVNLYANYNNTLDAMNWLDNIDCRAIGVSNSQFRWTANCRATTMPEAYNFKAQYLAIGY